MFLVVLVVTFMFAKMITKPSEFERFGEHEVETEHDHDEDGFREASIAKGKPQSVKSRFLP